MEDARILLDTYNIYYNKSLEALKAKDYVVAKRNLKGAAESLLKLAKVSKGNLKVERMNRAKELVEFISKVDAQIQDKALPNKGDNSKNQAPIVKRNKNEIATEEVSLEDSLKELNSLVGLKEVKQQVSDLIDYVRNVKNREANGLPNPTVSYHMVFKGPSGTGKTTVARIIGQIYKSLGVLSKGHVVEVDRSGLVAGYVGQTAIKTKAAIDEAMGGVLLIDEAYELYMNEQDTFGRESIDTLNKHMEDNRSDFVVIATGYGDEIDDFIASNQGLKSRFRTVIEFKPYSPDELYKIFLVMCSKYKFHFDTEASKTIYKYFRYNELTGNARDVRNIIESTFLKQSRRHGRATNKLSKNELNEFVVDDLPDYVIEGAKNANDDGFDTVIKPRKVADDEFDFTSSHDEGYVDFDNNNNVKEVKAKSKGKDKDEPKDPESEVMNGNVNGKYSGEYRFNWDDLPTINFDDIAGLDDVKKVVREKVIIPLENPEIFEGYSLKNGGGLFLYGCPGTGKTMIAAAIANEVGAKFCSVKPSDLLHQGAGNTEKAVRALFAQARQFPCAVIYFDEMDSIAMKNTRSSITRSLRSEMLAQIQGIESYGKETGNTLFLIAASNKPWDVDSAFLRPGRFGTRVYVGLPDEDARRYMITKRFESILDKGIVDGLEDIDIEDIVQRTNGYNGSDISALLDSINSISAIRSKETNYKVIYREDIEEAFSRIHSSVQPDDIEKLSSWKDVNDR